MWLVPCSTPGAKYELSGIVLKEFNSAEGLSYDLTLVELTSWGKDY